MSRNRKGWSCAGRFSLEIRERKFLPLQGQGLVHGPWGPFQLRIFHDSVMSGGVFEEGFAVSCSQPGGRMPRQTRHPWPLLVRGCARAWPADPRAQECPCLPWHCQSSPLLIKPADNAANYHPGLGFPASPGPAGCSWLSLLSH